jgi:hypothetical protein
VVTDDKSTDESCPAVSTVGNNDGNLDPGESITCTASYTVTQADVNAGSVTNTAFATAGGTQSNNDDETLNAEQLSALSLVKTADPITYDEEGDVIAYSYLVTNTGNVALAGPVTVFDDKSTDESCPAVSTVGNANGNLDPGESIVCTASYTITGADMTGGSVTNTAYATADGTQSNNDQETVYLVAITIQKEVSDDGTNFDTASVTAQAPADAWYRITVTNTGASPLNDVTVTDDDLVVSQNIGSLAVGETVVLVPYTPVEPNEVEWSDLFIDGFCDAEDFSFPNTATVIGTSDDDGSQAVADDAALYECLTVRDLCALLGGRPSNLKVEYNGTSTGINEQGVVCENEPYPAIVDIQFYDKNKPTQLFEDVLVGDMMTIMGKFTQGNSGKIPPDIKVDIIDPSTGFVIETFNFHGSCSAPLNIGDEICGLTIVGGTN